MADWKISLDGGVVVFTDEPEAHDPDDVRALIKRRADEGHGFVTFGGAFFHIQRVIAIEEHFPEDTDG